MIDNSTTGNIFSIPTTIFHPFKHISFLDIADIYTNCSLMGSTECQVIGRVKLGMDWKSFSQVLKSQFINPNGQREHIHWISDMWKHLTHYLLKHSGKLYPNTSYDSGQILPPAVQHQLHYSWFRDAGFYSSAPQADEWSLWILSPKPHPPTAH